MAKTSGNKIVAVLNQKGGSGKTTTAVNLASALARLGRKTLLVDLDPQGHATVHLGINAYDLELTVLEVLGQGAKAKDAVISTDTKNLDLLPSNLNLSGAEVEFSTVVGREQLLKKALSALLRRYDHILIDCPPALGVLTLNALCASSSVLVPVAAEFFALEGMGRLLQTIDVVNDRLGHKVKVGKVLITRYDKRKTLCRDVEGKILEFFPSGIVFKTRIRENVRLAEAPSNGCDVFEYDASSAGAEDYKAVAKEFVKHG